MVRENSVPNTYFVQSLEICEVKGCLIYPKTCRFAFIEDALFLQGYFRKHFFTYLVFEVYFKKTIKTN